MAVDRARRTRKKPMPIPRQNKQYPSESMSWASISWTLISWILIGLLDIFLTFRLEYLYPIYLVIYETHDLWRCSSLSSIFFLLITITTDMAIYSISKNHEYLFVVAGFLVWIHVACSGENKAAFHTVTVVCLIVSLEVVMNYHSKLREGGYFKADVLRPVAAHCIGYPLVSIGYCLKRYLQYLLRLRKQGEVENKNKFYYQILHEALPPENYQHHEYREILGEVDHSKDETSSTSSDANFESKNESSSCGWGQWLVNCLSDMLCFNRTSRSPLVTIQSPSRSPVQSTSSSSKSTSQNSSLKIWDRLRSGSEIVSSAFSSMLKAKSKPKNADRGPGGQGGEHQSVNSSLADQTSKNTSSGTGTRERNNPHARNRSLVSQKPAKDPSPKTTLAETTKHGGKGHGKTGKTGSDTVENEPPAEYRTPAKLQPARDSISKSGGGNNYDMQIRPHENGILSPGNSPAKSLDFNDSAEVTRLSKDVNRRKKVEAELRNKIKDLELHEDFTREELKQVRKSDGQNRQNWNREREKRVELENLLKKEEEGRKTAERTLAEERRKNSNIAELEQSRAKVRSLELDYENLRKETSSRQEESLKFQEERNGTNEKIRQLEKQLENERREKRNIQDKLDGESKLKMSLFVQLNKEKSDREKVERENIALRDELRCARRSPLSPSPSPIQSPSSAAASSFSNGFARFADTSSLDRSFDS